MLSQDKPAWSSIIKKTSGTEFRSGPDERQHCWKERLSISSEIAPAHLVTLPATFPNSNASNFQCIDSSTESACQDRSWGSVLERWHGHSGPNYPVWWQWVQGSQQELPAQPLLEIWKRGKTSCHAEVWASGQEAAGSNLEMELGNRWGFWQVVWANWTSSATPLTLLQVYPAVYNERPLPQLVFSWHSSLPLDSLPRKEKKGL